MLSRQEVDIFERDEFALLLLQIETVTLKDTPVWLCTEIHSSNSPVKSQTLPVKNLASTVFGSVEKISSVQMTELSEYVQ